LTGSIKIWISARALAILQSHILISAANGAPVLLARLLAEPASAARATAAITTFRILYRLGRLYSATDPLAIAIPSPLTFSCRAAAGALSRDGDEGVLDRGATAPQPRPQLKASTAQIRVICARAIE